MKKAKLNFKGLENAEVLSREEMKNVLGGGGYSPALIGCGIKCTTDSDCNTRFSPCRVCAPLNPNYNTCYTAPLD